MTEVIDFHDCKIESLLVESKARRMVLRAFDAHAPEAPTRIATFTGVEAYCLLGDVLGTIIFDIEEQEPFTLYEGFQDPIQAAGEHGGHAAWTASAETARDFLRKRRLRGFELSSSIGAIGAIWCRDFVATTEPRRTS